MLTSIVSKARELLPAPTLSSSRLLLQQAAAVNNNASSNETLPLWILRAKKAALLTKSSCIPVSLVGGTAVLYKAVLEHPSSTSLTPVALVYLVLLASQYAFQPTLSKRFIAKTTVKSSLTLTEELIKATLAIVGLVISSSSSSASSSSSSSAGVAGQGIIVIWNKWQWTESVKVAGIPAALYALQGILQYTAYLHLDAVTYNGLSQTKVLSSALACAVLLGQIPTQRQCVALGLLVLSTLIFQGTWVFQRRRPQQQHHQNGAKTKNDAPVVQSSSSSSSSVSVDTNANNHVTTWWFRGVLPCLGATLLSGVAGALSQKGLQQTHNGGRNAYLYTLEVSAYSAVAALVISLIRRFFLGLHVIVSSSSQQSTTTTTTQPGGTMPKQGTEVGTAKHRSPAVNGNKSNDGNKEDVSLFRDWTVWTFLPIICKAMGGVLTALVHKHAGSVSKGFALTLGLVLSTAITDQALQLHQVLGTMLVMLSSWLHFSIPKTM